MPSRPQLAPSRRDHTDQVSDTQKRSVQRERSASARCFALLSYSEAPVGIEPTVGDLQSPALPLGDGAESVRRRSRCGLGRAIYPGTKAIGSEATESKRLNIDRPHFARRSRSEPTSCQVLGFTGATSWWITDMSIALSDTILFC